MPGYGPGFARAGGTGGGTILAALDIAALRLNTTVVGGAILDNNYVSGDRGGEFYVDGADVSSPDDGVFIIVDAGGRRFKRYVDDVIVSARVAGAVLNGVTSDEAAFARLDASVTARQYYITLEGKAALVTTLKKAQRYVRGFQRQGGNDYALPDQITHPYDNGHPPLEVLSDGFTHWFNGAVGYTQANDELWLAVYRGWRHSQPQVGTPLKWIWSRDGGIEFTDRGNPIYSERTTAPAFVTGGMGNNGTRCVICYAILDGAGANVGLQMAYTDNRGFTTSAPVNVGTIASWISPHGYCVTSAGTLLFTGSRGNEIWGFRSTDNGLTAASAPYLMCVAGGGVTTPREPYPVALSGGRILVFIRDDAGGNLGVAASSDDGLTFTAIRDSGIPASANPPFVDIWGSTLYVYVVSQNGDPVVQRINSLLYAELDSETYFAQVVANTITGTPPMFEAMKTRDNLIGYTLPATIREFTKIAFTTAAETPGLGGSNGPSSTAIVRLGGPKVPSTSPAILRNRRIRPPLNRNPFSLFDTRQGSYLGITAQTNTLDGFAHQSGFVGVDVTRGYNDDNIQKLLFGRGNRHQRLVSAVGGSGRVIYSILRGRDAIEPYLDQNGFGFLQGYGTAQTYVQFGATLNPGTGGAPAGGNSGTPGNSQVAVIPTDGLVECSSQFVFPTKTGVTWGTNADLDATLTLFCLFNGAGVMDFRIPTLYWDLGDKFIPLISTDFDEARYYMDKYIERKTWTALQPIGQSFAMDAGGGEAIMYVPFQPKVGSLTGGVTYTTSAFGTFNQFNGAVRDPTAVNVLSGSRYGVELELVNAGIAANEQFRVRAAAGQTAFILGDTGL